MIYDIFNRLENFNWEDWIKLRNEGKILQGRFLNGKVRYVKKEDAPLFLSAYSREPLNQFDKKVLEVVRENKGISFFSIVEKMKEDKDKVKESIEKLDRNLYLIRKFHRQEGLMNIYVPFEVEGDVEDAKEKIVLRFLKAYGPVPAIAIRGYTSFAYDEIDSILERLERQGILERILVTGKSETEMLILKEEVKELEKIGYGDIHHELKILSLYDPWIQPMWAEVASRYGEGWIFLLVKDGQLCGMIEKWQMSGCIEIREIDLKERSLLKELLVALDKMMEFHKQAGYEILRIVRAFGKEAEEIEELSPFLENGYHKLEGFLAKGNFLPFQFEKQDVMKYVFWKQGLPPQNRYLDVVDAVIGQGGLRSDFASRLRVKEFKPLEKLHKMGILARGQIIPGYWTYCTEEDLMLYKRAKDAPLDEYMEEILDLIKAQEPLSREKLLSLSPYGYGSTTSAVNKLYSGLYITRDENNRYRTIPDAKLPAKEARKIVLRRIVENFGIVSAENLSAYTKFE